MTCIHCGRRMWPWVVAPDAPALEVDWQPGGHYVRTAPDSATWHRDRRGRAGAP